MSIFFLTKRLSINNKVAKTITIKTIYKLHIQRGEDKSWNKPTTRKIKITQRNRENLTSQKP